MSLSTPTELLTLLAELPFFASLAIKSLLLLLLALLLHFYAKKRQPQWHVYLWRATAIALLLLPVIGLIRLPVLAQTQALQEGQKPDVFVSATPPAADRSAAPFAANSEQTSLLEAQAIAAAASVATPVDGVGGPAAVAAKADVAGESSPSHFALGWRMFYGLWGAGVFVLLLRLLAGALATGALLRRASPCSTHIQQLAETVAARSGIGKMPAIRKTADLQSPALCNALKPVLLIPKSMADDASTNELEAILSHELTHFKANDLQWNLLIQVAAILYWVNPLAWRMRIRHLSACELLADAASAKVSGGADAYSQLLARIALSINAKRQHTGLAMARSANVLRRIRQLPITLAQTPIRRRWLISALVAFALACAATGSTLVVRTKSESPAAQEPTNTAAAAEPAPASAQQAGYMDVRIINTQGEPLADATLRANYYLEGERQQLPIADTGNGTFRLTLEEKMRGSLYLYSNASGYVTMRANWHSLETNAMPKQYTFHMEPATRIGGRVVNEKGDPVADATVKVSVYLSNSPTSGAADYSVSKEVTTNAEGIWSFDGIPPQLDADKLGLMITHTGYAPLDDRYRYRDPINESSATVKAAWMEELRSGTQVSTLKKGYHIAGQITLPDGSPAVGAEVGSGWSPNAGDGSWQTTTADAEGRYQFNNVPPISDSGKAVLTVINPDYAPAIRVVTLGADNNDTDIQLEAGHPVRIRVVDSEGKPLSDVSVHLSYLTSFRNESTQYPIDSLFGKAPTRAFTNAKGEFEWLWAPQDVVTYDFSKDGYMRLDGDRLNPSPDWQTITLKPEMRVEATVVDAQTGKPIPSFSVMEYSQLDPRVSNYWRSDSDFNGTDGAFSLTLGKHYRDNNQQGWRIAVSADGYTVQEQVVSVDATSPVRLEYRLEAGNQPTGKLTTQAGIAIPRAEIALLTDAGDQGYYTVFNGQLGEYPSVAAKAITAPDGSFRLRALGKKGILLALTNKGYAIANYTPESTEPLHLTLTPWGQLSGTLTRNPGLSVQEQRMSLSTSVKHGEIGVSFVSAVQTNQSGQYHFPRVAAGDNKLQYVLTHTQGNVTSSGLAGPQLTATVQAGEPTTLNYDARGMDVTGEVDLSAMGDAYQWGRGNISFMAVNPAEVLKDIPNADLDGLYYAFYVAEDGSFRSNGVLPGVYNIYIRLYEPNNPFGDPSAVGNATITVPAGKAGEVVNIGAIKLHLPEDADAADSDSSATSAADANAPAAAAEATTSATNTPAPASAQEAGYMDVRIINTQGKAIADAKLRAEYSWKGPSPVTAIEQTGDGTFRIELKTQKEMPGSLSLYVETSGYVTLSTQWSPLDKDVMPLEYTFQMEPVTRIGGRVVDEKGEGIVNATVEISLYQDTYPSGLAYPYLLQYPVTTDARGYWTCDKVPQALRRLGIQASHPDYTASNMLVPTSMYQNLKDGTFITTLKKNKNYTLTGTVRLPDGTPAEGAEVRAYWSSSPSSHHSPVTQTDAQGHYTFNDIESSDGNIRLYAMKPGYAPQEIEAELKDSDSRLNIELQAGHVVRIKLVDPQGQPLEGVRVSMIKPAFEKSPVNRELPLRTDAQGQWEWTWAPEADFTYGFYKEGYIQRYGVKIAPPGETVTLIPAVKIEATVVDAETGEPIPYFSVQEYWQQDARWSSYWQSSRTFHGTDGKFETTLDQVILPDVDSWRIGVSARGYMQQEKRVSAKDGSSATLHYELKKAASVTAEVVSIDGVGLPDIEVKLIPRKQGNFSSIQIMDGTLRSFHPVAAQIITDRDGRFTFEPSTDDYTLVVIRNDGYASARYTSGSTEPIRLVLTPWMRIYGKLTLNPGENPAERMMMISSSSTPDNLLFFTASARTNAKGEYQFNHLGSTTGFLSLNYFAQTTMGKEVNSVAMSGPGVRVEFQPGKTVRVDYNAQGLDVIGRFDFGAMPDDYKWESSSGTFYAIGPEGDAAAQGRSASNALYFMSITPDGSYNINGVKPGRYNVNVRLFGKNARFESDPSAVGEATVTVPEGKPGEVFDAGAIKLHLPKEAKEATLGTD